MKITCFNANGLKKEINNRSYKVIFEKNTTVLVTDTVMTDIKLNMIKTKANKVDKEVFAYPNNKSNCTGGTMIWLPRIYKSQPKLINDE